METSSKTVRGLAVLLGVLGIASAVVPASAGAETSAISPGLSLVFASGNARSVADNVAVPVRCLGYGRGFCSGQVTLSRNGHHISIPVSVRAGGKELIFVPLRLTGVNDHPRRVHGAATTIQPIGPATTTREFLYAK